MIDIISLSPVNLSNSIQYLMDKRLKSLIGAYDDTFSPTVKFTSTIDYIEDKYTLSEFDWYNKDEDICLKKSIELYDFDQRIRYGFPIESEKKAKLLTKLKSSKYGYNRKK